ncbi:unnamed protein product, partial [Enterobius vermicularis]|uniref:EF-hand domain-containing protein n=1 Tax=Enterobius vermicularis TaxID=51028 RepID=A0A0N4VFJ7_ENTVE
NIFLFPTTIYKKIAFQTQYFSQRQIDEYRQCFYLYCHEGIVHNSSQLRYIMRSLGYSPTIQETINYFQDYGCKKVDFASFLQILHAETKKEHPMKQIMAALQCIDRTKRGWITVPEFVSILSSVGEKMSREEIENAVRYLDENRTGRITYPKLMQFISSVL